MTKGCFRYGCRPVNDRFVTNPLGPFFTQLGCETGVGLLWYGQNYLIYPASFPEGSRTSACHLVIHVAPGNSYTYSDVPVPTQYDLPYEDLTLVTRDGVKIRCYLLTQRKELNLATKTTFESLQEAEEPPEKVDTVLYLRFRQAHVPGYSMPPLDQRLSCFTGMVETWGIGYRSRRFSTSRCAAM
jgi:hypothetical protein